MSDSAFEPSAFSALPEFQPWSSAAVRLLQGVVYDDDEKVWNEILISRSRIEPWVGRIGLVLVIDEPGGYAYLRQLDETGDVIPEGYDSLPKLFRRSRLSYGATLLCVLLREEMRRFEDEEVDWTRCVIEEEELFAQWRLFFPEASDEQRQRKHFASAMKSVSEFGFARRLEKVEPVTYEVRRIIKAKINAASLEELKSRLTASGPNGKEAGK